ncbi:MAG: DUF333 domain-containing protein [Oligoflexia bacterium]|nr:DUF333 domain-containing protein [Oligoflexia bacterium]
MTAALLVSSFTAYAATAWKIDGKTIQFVRVKGAHQVGNCTLKAGAPSCRAALALENTVLKSGLLSDANPAAILCEKIGGTVKIGVDAKRNENSFCLFGDGSLVSTAALYASALANGGVYRGKR